jgi:UDP-N-acetylmuramoyl-tripeptide--D-alanyl-D-alanine ligase
VIPVRLADIAGARVVRGDPAAVVTGVVADSRRARPGDLFVALPGTRADGHAFVGDAAERGALGALCRTGEGPARDSVALLESDSPEAALWWLARVVRDRSPARVVGVAGSAGKTSTKDILGALCAAHVPTVASPLSFNNELGVPLTLCSIAPGTRVAICELGTGALGEVSALAALARPDVGVITAVGPEHLASFGTLANVARAEAELLLALPSGGTAVLPYGERLLAPYRRRDVAELTFGAAAGADVRPLRRVRRGDTTEVVLDVCGRRVQLRTDLRAPHHLLDLAAAVAAYVVLGLPLDRVAEGAAAIRLSPLRDAERDRADGGVVINDAYNANPLSMAAALAALAERRGEGRLVAVLGEMAELGPRSQAWHRHIGRRAAALGVELLVGVGAPARDYCGGAAGVVPTAWFGDLEDAAAGLPALLVPGDVVLLKGSRSAALERLEDVVA